MKHVIFGLAVAASFASFSAVASPELAKAKNCLACHTTNTKLVGPAFAEVGKRYGKDAGAEAKIVKQIREGGQGKWGPVTMPPQPQVSEDEAKQLAKWILSLGK